MQSKIDFIKKFFNNKVTFCKEINDFKQEECTVLIWGFGKTGRSVLNFLMRLKNKKKYIISICDKKYNEEAQEFAEKTGGKFFLETEIRDLNSKINYEIIDKIDFIIPSPGIELDPEKMYFFKIITEFDLFYYYEILRFKKNFDKKEIITITGSVGKTSVATITYKILKNFYPTALGGNIGIPLCDLLENEELKKKFKNQKKIIYVIEASSNQLEYSKIYSSDFIIYTNIYENHLDRHKNFNDYFRAKFNLILNSDKSKKLKRVFLNYEILESFFKIYNLNMDNRSKDRFFDENYFNKRRRMLNIIYNQKFLPFLQFDSDYLDKKVLMKDYYYMKRHVIISRIDEKIKVYYFKKIKAIERIDLIEKILLFDPPKITLDINWGAIGSLMQHFDKVNLSREYLDSIDLSIPDHRIEYCGNKYGIYFYNDSKSTIMESSYEALKSLKIKHLNEKITIILGGLSKGVDRTKWLSKISNIANEIIFFGKEKEIFFNQAKIFKLNIYVFDSLQEAINKAVEAKEGGVVLFSPGGSSFDLFSSYEDRGNKFKEIVSFL